MLNGLYAAASGLRAQQDRLDTLSSDVANVSTTGYKRGRLAFRDLVYVGEDPVRRGMGVAVDPAGRSWAQGPLADSSSPLHVALEGPGFLQVRRLDGSLALTRSGELGIDADGSIVLPGGERLEPPIRIPEGTDLATIAIASDGTVTTGETVLGTIQVVNVPARRGLEAVGDTLFAPTVASGQPVAITGTNVRQGLLEMSNVDLGTALVGVLEAQRATEMASRALRTQDQLLDIANQIRR